MSKPKKGVREQAVSAYREVVRDALTRDTDRGAAMLRSSREVAEAAESLIALLLEEIGTSILTRRVLEQISRRARMAEQLLDAAGLLGGPTLEIEQRRATVRQVRQLALVAAPFAR